MEGGPLSPLEVDGWIGQHTNRAITRFQQHHFTWSDGTVHPGQRTHAKLREYQGVQRPGDYSSGTSGNGRFVADPVTMARFHGLIANAKGWINAAIRKLELARDFAGGRGYGGESYALVDKYFHLDQLPRPSVFGRIVYLERIFYQMRSCIAHSSPATSMGSGYFQEDPSWHNHPKSKVRAFTHYGGYTRRSRHGGGPPMSKEDNYTGPNLRQDAIYVCTAVIKKWKDETLTETLVHELAHFCGPEVDRIDRIGDWSYRHRPDFFRLNAFTAVRTADCYSEFAGEARLRREVKHERLPQG
jgi:hypothetical protein